MLFSVVGVDLAFRSTKQWAPGLSDHPDLNVITILDPFVAKFIELLQAMNRGASW